MHCIEIQTMIDERLVLTGLRNQHRAQEVKALLEPVFNKMTIRPVNHRGHSKVKPLPYRKSKQHQLGLELRA